MVQYQCFIVCACDVMVKFQIRAFQVRGSLLESGSMHVFVTPFLRSGTFLDIADLSAQIELARRFLRVGRFPRSSNGGIWSSGMTFFSFDSTLFFHWKTLINDFAKFSVAAMSSAGHPIQNPRAAGRIYIQRSTTLSSFRSQLVVVVRLELVPHFGFSGTVSQSRK